MRWVSSFGIDPAYYRRLTESDLYQRILLPIFGAAYGTFERAELERVTVNRCDIASSFVCNTALCRRALAMRALLTPSPPLTTKASESAEVDDTSCYFSRAITLGTEDEEAALPEDSSAAVSATTAPPLATHFGDEVTAPPTPAHRGKSKTAASATGLRRSRLHDVPMLVKQDAKRYNANLKSLAIDSPDPVWCDCCMHSYRILLTFDDKDDNIYWREYFRSMASPTVYVNVRVLLGWPLTPEEFVRDFTFSPSGVAGDLTQSRSFLRKTLAIYKMGFYQRIYSVHLWVYFIVMWLWACQRSVHERCGLASSASDNDSYSAFAVGAFPVHLVVQKKLRKLFDSVPSLPLSKLLQTQKLFIQYI